MPVLAHNGRCGDRSKLPQLLPALAGEVLTIPRIGAARIRDSDLDPEAGIPQRAMDRP